MTADHKHSAPPEHDYGFGSHAAVEVEETSLCGGCGEEHHPADRCRCEAAACMSTYLTMFRDGKGRVWGLCERHADQLAVGFRTDPWPIRGGGPDVH